MFEHVPRDITGAWELPLVILRYFNVAGADLCLRAGPPLEGTTYC